MAPEPVDPELREHYRRTFTAYGWSEERIAALFGEDVPAGQPKKVVTLEEVELALAGAAKIREEEEKVKAQSEARAIDRHGRWGAPPHWEVILPPSGTFLGDFARENALDSEAHKMGFLAAGLAVMSALFGPRMRIQWGRHSEYLHVYLMLVGQSAMTHKSTIQASAKRAVKALVAAGVDIREKSPDRVSDASLYEALDASKKYETEDPDNPGKMKTEVRAPDTPSSVIVWVNELAPILDSRQKAERSMRDALLMVYDGEMSSMTKSTPVPLQPVSPTIFANIVEEDFSSMLSDPGTIASGFLGRWVPIAIPEGVEEKAEPTKDDAIPSAPAASGHLDDLVRLVTNHDAAHGGVVGGQVNAWNNATEEASKERKEWYRAYNPRTFDWGDASDDERRALTALFGRMQATAIKLAVMHAISRQAKQVASLEEVVVDRQDVVWGARMMSVMRQFLERELENIVSGGRGAVEQRALDKLKQAGGKMSRSQLASKMTTRTVSYEDATRAIDSLVKSQVITETTKGRGTEIHLTGKASK